MIMNFHLVLLCFSLFSLHSVSAYNYNASYNGFNDCGSGGWTCSAKDGTHETKFDCKKAGELDTRIWIWTARIPRATTNFTISNCRIVEIHMDCTVGYRYSENFTTFTVENAQLATILPPLRPRVFLHDNEESIHAPPVLIFKNVTEITWPDEAFQKAPRRCRSKAQLQEIAFDNVGRLPAFTKLMFDEQSLTSLSVSNCKKVEILGLRIESSGMYLTNNQAVIGSGFTFHGTNITLANNEIDLKSVVIEAHSLLIKGNRIKNLQLATVVSANVTIIENKWNEMRSNAFEKVQPGKSVMLQYIFTFNNNQIQNIGNISLHPNELYIEVCSRVSFENNIVPCNCSSINSPYMEQLGRHASNKCLGVETCSVEHIRNLDACVNLATGCIDPSTTTELTDPPTTTTAIEESSTVEVVRVLDETESQKIVDSGNMGMIVGTIVGLLVLATLAVGGVYFYNFRRSSDVKVMLMRESRDIEGEIDDENDQAGLLSESEQSRVTISL